MITSPDDPLLDDLCRQLAERAAALDVSEAWPADQLRLCGEYGVFSWFVPSAWGGQGWNDAAVLRGYLRLSAACLTTTFILTQRTGACQRIAGSANRAPGERWLGDLLTAAKFATVGISHLTTSRRHLAQPVMRAEFSSDGFVLDGYSPWVTGGNHADVVVTGATLPDGQQILLALPTELAGVSVPAPPRLVGLTASQTGQVECRGVHVPSDCLLAGPAPEVMKLGAGGGTGGLQTSTLAIGLSGAAIDYLSAQAAERGDLLAAAQGLRAEKAQLEADLLSLVAGAKVCTNEELRTRANSLVLRATQAALAAAKGTGYVVGHPAGRWCRESLFFLVWSCPQPVLAANLCELAGLE